MDESDGAKSDLLPRTRLDGANLSSIEAVEDLWARVADVDPFMYYWKEPDGARAPSTGGEDQEESDSSPFLPGRRPLYKRPAPPITAEEELAHVITFLQRLQSSVSRGVARGEAPSAAEAGLTVLQSKRLSRTGVTPDHFQIGVLPKTWSALPADGAASKPDAPAPAATVQETPATRQEPAPSPAPPESGDPKRRAPWPVLTGGLLLAALGLAACLWARTGVLSLAAAGLKRPSEHAQPAPAAEAEPSEESLNAVNLALEAMQRGDFAQASDLLAKTRKQGTGLRGLFYQAALLAFNQGQPAQADNFIAESIALNEAVAECWYLRANASFFNSGPVRAAQDFEQAAHAAPFSPRYYFFRAECLRRNGNTAAAVSQFQQALRCRPSSADTELILFKIGMAKLESNTDLIFKTELHDHLSHAPVSGDNLLLAAADAISRNEYAEAADDLKRAAQALPPRTFQSRVRDYVFRSQAEQPDIAAALKLTLSTAPAATPPGPRTTRVLVDPATRSLGEADPAGW